MWWSNTYIVEQHFGAHISFGNISNHKPSLIHSILYIFYSFRQKLIDLAPYFNVVFIDRQPSSSLLKLVVFKSKHSRPLFISSCFPELFASHNQLLLHHLLIPHTSDHLRRTIHHFLFLRHNLQTTLIILSFQFGFFYFWGIFYFAPIIVVDIFIFEQYFSIISTLHPILFELYFTVG